MRWRTRAQWAIYGWRPPTGPNTSKHGLEPLDENDACQGPRVHAGDALWRGSAAAKPALWAVLLNLHRIWVALSTATAVARVPGRGKLRSPRWLSRNRLRVRYVSRPAHAPLGGFWSEKHYILSLMWQEAEEHSDSASSHDYRTDQNKSTRSALVLVSEADASASGVTSQPSSADIGSLYNPPRFPFLSLLITTIASSTRHRLEHTTSPLRPHKQYGSMNTPTTPQRLNTHQGLHDDKRLGSYIGNLG
ncbi:hypothetical protein C8Q80DRAFT_928752 [Daedaleopsis nitida]|nr:hypothetical protein C8Q80DRAFT_928752 [Daedaleopsis nitida]